MTTNSPRIDGLARRESLRISKFLSYVLRHDPGAVGLHVDKEGWASVGELISCAARTGRSLTLKKLREVVVTSEKKRFSFSTDGQRIRAVYGHSINVELSLKPVIPPQTLYHGTAENFLESILKDGLRPLGRRHVHLSPDADIAEKIGRRHGSPVVLKIDSHRMHADGCEFYSPHNTVWLTGHVPPGYVKKHVSIVEEIDLVERLFHTVSRLMKANGFESYYPGLSNDNQRLLGSAKTWLQYLTQRLYVRNDVKRILGIDLSMNDDPDRNQMPFFACALIHVATEMVGRSEEICRVGWNTERGTHVKDHRSPLILSLHPEKQTAIVRYLVKFTGSMDQDDIERLIVVPLVRMYEAIPEIVDLASVNDTVKETIAAICDYTLTLEDAYDSTLVH